MRSGLFGPVPSSGSSNLGANRCQRVLDRVFYNSDLSNFDGRRTI